METKSDFRAGAGWLLGMLLAALLLFALASCSRDEAVMAPDLTSMGSLTAGIDPEMAAGEVVLASSWRYDPEVALPPKLDLLADKAERYRILDSERVPLVGDIVHYKYTVSVGPGAHEKIRLHRVVKEEKPNLPIRTRKSVFALHGAPGNFNQWFLVGAVAPSAPPSHGMAIYLAQNDIDVWGIDQAYNLVPPTTANFSFMADWGLQYDIDNLSSGMAIARFTRRFTGNGFDKMTLIGIGHGGGGITGYAALNEETRLPHSFRNIGAFIPIAACCKTDNPIWQTYFSASAKNYSDMLKAGTYVDTQGQMFATMASYALSDPGGDSPFMRGFTNKGAVLFMASMTWVPLQFPNESHYLGGVFKDNLPVDLKYSALETSLEGTQQIDPYTSVRYRYEVEALKGGTIDLPFDDHFSDITVPVMAVCAGGYMGGLAGYTTTLLGSDDITILSVTGDDMMMTDIGILDISHARKAPTMIWQNLLKWIEEHTGPDPSETPINIGLGG